MTKCLVTKLAGIVQNDELLKIGEMVLDISRTDSTTCSIESTDNQAKATIVTPGFNFIKNGAQFQSVVLDGQVTFPAGTYKVKISNKYAINVINPTPNIIDLGELKYNKVLYRLGGNFKGNLSDLGYQPTNYTELIECNINWTNDTISGDIASLIPFANLRDGVSFNSKYITGDVTSIADITAIKNGSCTKLICENGSLTGSIENLVSKLRTNLSASGKLTLGFYGCSGVTFGEHSASEFSHDISSSLEWTNNSIFYINSTQVFAKGASSSQISNWQSAGKTVYEIS